MENESNNGAAENYPLDEPLTTMLADIDKARVTLQRQADLLSAQEQGALVLFVRQHKLTGNWQVAENRRELVKQPEPAQTPQP